MMIERIRVSNFKSFDELGSPPTSLC